MKQPKKLGPRSFDLQEILEGATGRICRRLGAGGCALYLLDGGEYRPQSLRGVPPAAVGDLQSLRPPSDLGAGFRALAAEAPEASGSRWTGWIGLDGSDGRVGAALLWWDDEPGEGSLAACEGIGAEVGSQIEKARLFLQVERAKQEWEATVDGLHEGIAVLDTADGSILRANWALAQHLDVRPGELVGRPFRQTVFEPLGLGGCLEEERGDTPEEQEIEARGRIWRLLRYPLDTGRATVVILEDVTERRRAHQELVRAHQKIQESMDRLRATQAQLVQSEKMAAVGQLVSGVAHELNNPLTAVLGFSQLLQRADDEEKRGNYIEIIGKEAERARKIVQNLLTFARKRKAEKATLDLNEVVEKTLELKAYEMRVSGIELVTELAEDLPETSGDFQQLQQVLLNLIQNAAQAVLADKGTGRLEVRTRLRREGEEGDPALDPPSLVLEVRDDGPGIPDAHLHRIFEPFFTTKEVGQGTGLGLSIAYGILQEHGGSIRAESTLGEGTLFRIEVPVTAADPALTERGPEAVAVADTVPRRILVVDDEESIRRMLQDLLEEDGHTVATASDGRLALQALGSEEAGFDLIFTDLKMPVLDGYGFYTQLRQQKPELADRVVFITGDTVSQETRNFLLRAGRIHLPKPLSIQRLREVVREVSQAVG